MKLTITGGTGFIGSRLALTAHGRGHSVTVLGQTNTPAEIRNNDELVGQGIDVVLGNVNDTDQIGQVLADTDVIIHLAAAQHEANVPDQHFHDVNVTGTKTLLELAISRGVKRFVLGSTIGVYGAALEGEIDESTPARPDNIYGRTKLEAEELAAAYSGDIELVVIRISETYGPGDARLLKLFKAVKGGTFPMIGQGSNLHQLIYIDDLNEGLLLAAEDPRAIGETILLSGSEKLTTRQMTDTISESIGVSLRRIPVPLWIAKGVATVCETLCRPFGIQPPIHHRRLDFFIKSFYFSNDKSKNLLGLSPQVDFTSGTRKTFQWYEENGLI